MNAAPLHRTLRSLGVALALGACALSASAQGDAYPNKPIRLVLPYAVGGSSDILARMLGPKLAESLGQPVVIENRPGAGGIIGVSFVGKAPADGYTLLMSSSAEAMLPSLYQTPPYDYVNGFTPVSMLVSFPFMIVASPTLPAKNIAELVATAKAKPGGVTYASAGNGATSHIVPEQFATALGVKLLHVPYKGTGPAVLGLAGGEANIGIYSIASAGTQLKSGRLRALAFTGLKRSPAFPDVPTIAETVLPGYEASIWIGIVAPAGTPAAIVARLNREFTRVMRLPEVTERLAGLQLDLVASSAEEFGEAIRKDVAKWSKVVKDSGAKAD